jgi:hypothetical protein
MLKCCFRTFEFISKKIYLNLFFICIIYNTYLIQNHEQNDLLCFVLVLPAGWSIHTQISAQLP